MLTPSSFVEQTTSGLTQGVGDTTKGATGTVQDTTSNLPVVGGNKREGGVEHDASNPLGL